MASDPVVPLAPRRRPRQRRARATVDRILDATAALLEESGFERLTTNAIAARCGLNVASVYAYFPNKFAILAALWERTRRRQQAEWQAALAASRGGPRDPAALARRALVAFCELALREPGHAELAEAMRTAPELSALWSAEREGAVRRLTRLLREEPAPGLPRARAALVAPLLIETASGVSRLLRRAPARRREPILRELERMLAAYLDACAGERA